MHYRLEAFVCRVHATCAECCDDGCTCTECCDDPCHVCWVLWWCVLRVLSHVMMRDTCAESCDDACHVCWVLWWCVPRALLSAKCCLTNWPITVSYRPSWAALLSYKLPLSDSRGSLATPMLLLAVVKVAPKLICIASFKNIFKSNTVNFSCTNICVNNSYTHYYWYYWSGSSTLDNT